MRHQPRLWVFGYDMDNMKARAWVESVMPLILVPDEHRDTFEQLTANLVLAAQLAQTVFRKAIQNAWFKTGGSCPVHLSELFWQDTEPDFFSSLENIREALLRQCGIFGDEITTIKEAWLSRLRREAVRLFDTFSQSENLEQADPKRVAAAWRQLQKGLSPNNKQMREALELPAEKAGSRPGGRRGGRK